MLSNRLIELQERFGAVELLGWEKGRANGIAWTLKCNTIKEDDLSNFTVSGITPDEAVLNFYNQLERLEIEEREASNN